MLLRFLLILVQGFIRLIFRIRVHGKENMPKEGALIVALNHKSAWDAVLGITLLPRCLHFMAKKELFTFKPLGVILKWAGAFPVSRGTSDLSAIKTSLALLRAGHALAMFPEGRRVHQGEERNVKAGVAMIAEKTGAPVVPVAIAGRYRLFARIDVYIGKPVFVKSEDGSKLTGEQLQKISEDLMANILHMASEETVPIVKENTTWT